MARLSALIVTCLVSLSLMVGSLAHAAEPVTCLDSNIAASFGHVPGDHDEVPSDDGKATPHHHGGCVGHQIGEAVKEGFGAPLHLGVSLPLPVNARDRVSAFSDPADRPPRA